MTIKKTLESLSFIARLLLAMPIKVLTLKTGSPGRPHQRPLIIVSTPTESAVLIGQENEPGNSYFLILDNGNKKSVKRAGRYLNCDEYALSVINHNLDNLFIQRECTSFPSSPSLFYCTALHHEATFGSPHPPVRTVMHSCRREHQGRRLETKQPRSRLHPQPGLSPAIPPRRCIQTTQENAHRDNNHFPPANP